MLSNVYDIIAEFQYIILLLILEENDTGWLIITSFCEMRAPIKVFESMFPSRASVFGLQIATFLFCLTQQLSIPIRSNFVSISLGISLFVSFSPSVSLSMSLFPCKSSLLLSQLRQSSHSMLVCITVLLIHAHQRA